ncbi:MAG: glycosyltransferase [Anaerolineae bacterium]|nr:glycosyltransferase [Anaerolineae bacterium]
MENSQKVSIPLVSICVPTYNDGHFLALSLDSIVHQTYSNIEILVGDDASNDDTAEIVRSFDDPRIRYWRNEKNLGQFPNVNSLIQRARGCYVAVYHSDDQYEPDIVKQEVTFLEAHPQIGAVFALDTRIDAEGQILGITQLPEEVQADTCLTLGDLIPPLLRHKNRILRGPTFMGRSELFQKVGWFSDDYDIAGDFEMWLRILTAYPIAVLGEHLMRYRRGATQVSTGYNRLRTFEEHYFTIMDQYLTNEGAADQINQHDLDEYAFHRLDDQTFRAANWIIRGDIDQAQILLGQPYRWRTLLRGRQRRKLRVLTLRMLMKIGLALGANRPLTQLLIRTEYGGRL